LNKAKLPNKRRRIEITVDNTGRSINRFSMSKVFVTDKKSCYQQIN
jgi:hypothetical protein